MSIFYQIPKKECREDLNGSIYNGDEEVKTDKVGPSETFHHSNSYFYYSLVKTFKDLVKINEEDISKAALEHYITYRSF